MSSIRRRAETTPCSAASTVARRLVVPRMAAAEVDAEGPVQFELTKRSIVPRAWSNAMGGIDEPYRVSGSSAGWATADALHAPPFHVHVRVLHAVLEQVAVSCSTNTARCRTGS